MKSHLLTITAACALLPAVALAAVQDEQGHGANQADEAAERAPAADDRMVYATTEELIGENLWTRAVRGDETRVDLGDVHDFVIDAKSGRIDQVLVSSGGIGEFADTLRSVRFDQLSFTEGEEGEILVWIGMSPEDFHALPEIDESALEAYSAKSAANQLKRGLKRHDGTEDTTDLGDLRDARYVDRMLILASDYSDLDVRAPRADEAMASVDTVWLNCTVGAAAFATIQYDGSTYPVPCEILESSVDPDGEVPFLVVPHTPDEMNGSPVIDEENGHTLDDPEFRQRVLRHYASESGPSVSVEASARKSGKGDDGRDDG